MTVNKKKAMKLCLIFSILFIIVGYILWTIPIPIQDYHLMTSEELLCSRKQFAFNYPLGKLLLYIGFTGFIISSIYTIALKIRLSRNER